MDTEHVIYINIYKYTHIHTQNGILFIYRKERNSASSDNMEGPKSIMWNEIREIQIL